MMNYPQNRKSDLVIQEFENEVLIYDLKINKAFCLNETAHLVWELCNGTNSITDINKKLSKKHNISYPEDIVWIAIDQLKKNNLLELSSEIEINFGGLSRREIIRKLALYSVISLPVIASVVAPTAVHAATCVNPGGLAPGLSQSFPGLTCGSSCANCPCALGNCDSQCCSGIAISALDNSSMTLCFC